MARWARSYSTARMRVRIKVMETDKPIYQIMTDMKLKIDELQRRIEAEKPQWCFVCGKRLTPEEAFKLHNCHIECDPR
jgi:transcription initiation factor IIE alpha subunit